MVQALETYPESWLVDGEGQGTKAIKKSNGMYVSVDAFSGEIREQSYIGAWESGHRSGNELVFVNEGRAFALPIAVGL